MPEGRKPEIRVKEGSHGLKRNVVRMNMGMFLSFQQLYRAHLSEIR